jgi:hypothetical protein
MLLLAAWRWLFQSGLEDALAALAAQKAETQRVGQGAAQTHQLVESLAAALDLARDAATAAALDGAALRTELDARVAAAAQAVSARTHTAYLPADLFSNLALFVVQVTNIT